MGCVDAASEAMTVRDDCALWPVRAATAMAITQLAADAAYANVLVAVGDATEAASYERSLDDTLDTPDWAAV